jgi:hypothetical protein
MPRSISSKLFVIASGDANVYGSSYYWNFRTSSFKQVACLILTKVKTEITSLWPNSKVFIAVVVAFIICLLNTLYFYYEIHLKYCQDTDVYIDKSTIYFSSMENNFAGKRSMECKQNKAFESVCVFDVNRIIWCERDACFYCNLIFRGNW